MRGKRPSKTAISFYVLLALVAVLVIVGYLSKLHVAVLSPAGTVAQKERNLMLLALGLCSIVVVPVFSLAILISLRYREGNKRPRKYSPNWDGNRALEGTWWGVPFVIITILAVVTWQSSYSLDPYKALAAGRPAMTVEVISLDWKWLFIYPKQNIASVNWLEMPLNTPVDFEITSDTVMNSFWIPNLGSQIYSMPGMNTRLNLMATKTGNFLGRSANISGQGFAGMQFTAAVRSQADFNTWLNQVKTAGSALSTEAYAKLSKPSQYDPVRYYSSTDPQLYGQVISNYMGPVGSMDMEGGH